MTGGGEGEGGLRGCSSAKFKSHRLTKNDKNIVIIGIGIDIIETDRIREAADRWGERFLNRIFTEDELTYCFHNKFPHTHLAGRFASKEAAMKAFGTGLSRGITWKDVEVAKNAAGKPEIVLHGKMIEFAEISAVKYIHLSISHTNGNAIAQVILEGA